MNMLDMYTREKVHKIHLDKMHRDRRSYQLRHMNWPKNPAILKRIRLMLIFAALVILLSAGGLYSMSHSLPNF